MAEIKVLACDTCGRHAPEVEVKSYSITQNGSQVRVDLCADHAAPLTQVLASASTRTRRPRSRMEVIPAETPKKGPRKA